MALLNAAWHLYIDKCYSWLIELLTVLIYLSSGQGRGGAFNRPRGGGGRGPRRGRGGRGRGGRTGEKVSAEDLDAELEKYHATAETMQE